MNERAQQTIELGVYGPLIVCHIAPPSDDLILNLPRFQRLTAQLMIMAVDLSLYLSEERGTDSDTTKLKDILSKYTVIDKFPMKVFSHRQRNPIEPRFVGENIVLSLDIVSEYLILTPAEAFRNAAIFGDFAYKAAMRRKPPQVAS